MTTTLTGPQIYPGAVASGSSWYEDNWGGDPMDINVLVIHTTEGATLPTYSGGSVAPNITFVPDFKAKRLKAYQHYRTDISSRALVNKLGGVATNTNNVTQAEFVGTCDPATHKKWTAQGVQHIYWPEAPDWAIEDMAEYVAWLHEEHGVPLTAPAKWLPYPSSYGTAGGQRMSGAEWNKFRGVCGHQHVTENDHGDPGNIPIGRILARAKELLGLDEPKPPATPSHPKPTVPAFPGRKYFVLGSSNKYVTQLGAQLKKRGYGKHNDGDGYQPGPRFTEYDRLNVRDFQRSRKELRGDADGYPGPLTWKLLFS